MSTPANALDITQAGLVKFDGTAIFTGVTVTNHDVLVGSTSNGITSIAAGATNQVLLGNTGADPSFGAVPAGALPGSGAVTLSNGTNITVTGSPLSLGGTATIAVSGPPSATTLTTHGVLLGQGTSAITATAAGSSGQVLQSGGAGSDPTYSTSTYPTTNAANTLLYASSANTMAALATANNGVLITSASAVPSLLTNGTTGQVLTATTGSPPSWVTPSSVSSVLTSTGNITWTNAALKAGTSLLLLAAQGSGVIIVPVCISYKFIYGGTNVFTNSSNSQINYGTLYNTSTIASATLNNFTFWQASANQYFLENPGIGTVFTATVAENTSVYATLFTALTGNAAGDNTAVVQMIYYTVNLH